MEKLYEYPRVRGSLVGARIMVVCVQVSGAQVIVFQLANSVSCLCV